MQKRRYRRRIPSTRLMLTFSLAVFELIFSPMGPPVVRRAFLAIQLLATRMSRQGMRVAGNTDADGYRMSRSCQQLISIWYSLDLARCHMGYVA